MKRLLTLLMFIGCYQISTAQFSGGVGVSVVTGNVDAFGLQGRLMYGFNDSFTAGAVYNYYFDDQLANIIDADLQYNLLGNDGGFTLNPLAGIRFNTVGELDTDLHLGIYSVIPISDRYFYLEPKFVLSETDAFVISGGFKF